jgi:hypothetical protein
MHVACRGSTEDSLLSVRTSQNLMRTRSCGFLCVQLHLGVSTHMSLYLRHGCAQAQRIQICAHTQIYTHARSKHTHTHRQARTNTRRKRMCSEKIAYCFTNNHVAIVHITAGRILCMLQTALMHMCLLCISKKPQQYLVPLASGNHLHNFFSPFTQGVLSILLHSSKFLLLNMLWSLSRPQRLTHISALLYCLARPGGNTL